MQVLLFQTTCMHAHTRTHSHTCMHTHMYVSQICYTYVLQHIRIHLNTCMCTHIQARHTCVCLHTHIHVQGCGTVLSHDFHKKSCPPAALSSVSAQEQEPECRQSPPGHQDSQGNRAAVQGARGSLRTAERTWPWGWAWAAATCITEAYGD